MLRVSAIPDSDIAVHVVGLAALAAARRRGRARGGGRGRGAAARARRGAGHGVPAQPAPGQDPAHLPSQQQAHYGES